LATWGEIDVERKSVPASKDQKGDVSRLLADPSLATGDEIWTWSIPGGRMKNSNAFEVPLVARAVEILRVAAKLRLTHDDAEFIFPGTRRNQPLSDGALEMLLRRMGHDECTPHGFRSSFRDWCGDETDFPRELAEAVLSHTIGNKAERAYRRKDAKTKRRAVLEAWESFCLSAKVHSSADRSQSIREMGVGA